MANDRINYDVTDERAWVKIKDQAKDIKFGSVIITVQDGKIVQVETSTKVRF